MHAARRVRLEDEIELHLRWKRLRERVDEPLQLLGQSAAVRDDACLGWRARRRIACGRGLADLALGPPEEARIGGAAGGDADPRAGGEAPDDDRLDVRRADGEAAVRELGEHSAAGAGNRLVADGLVAVQPVQLDPGSRTSGARGGFGAVRRAGPRACRRAARVPPPARRPAGRARRRSGGRRSPRASSRSRRSRSPPRSLRWRRRTGTRSR